MDDQMHASGKGIDKVSEKIKSNDVTGNADANASGERKKVKFEIHGEELIEKIVKASGNSGRVYLPPDWIGHSVKIVRID
jgi:putative transposon-encoded protein